MNAIDRRRIVASLLGAAALYALAGCSSDSSGSGQTGSGSSGASASGSGSGTGGAATGSGGATTGSGGSGEGSGGATTGSGGSGEGSGGSSAGTDGGTGGSGVTIDGGGSGGAPATVGPTSKGYTCTLVMGVSVTHDWFTGGFEMGAGIDNARWEALASAQGEVSFIQMWADPNAALWKMEKLSPCAMNADSPDRVIFVGLNWNYKTVAEWLTQYDAVIKTIQAKFTSVKTIYLDTLIRGPGNHNCGGSDATSHVVVWPFIDDAIQMEVAKNPTLLKAAPKLYVPDCTVFIGAGPHYTAAGVKVVAKVYSDYYVNDQ